MTVTEALRRFRKEKKLTQKEIADYLGITQQMYQYYESNGGLAADLVKKIAEHYVVSTDYLLGLSDEPDGGQTPINEVDLKNVLVAFNQSSQALQKFMQKQYGCLEQ